MLGEYLKKYRVSHNLTQKQFADKLETTQSYYSLLESGSKKPSFIMIDRLSKVMNVDPSLIRDLL